MWPAINFTGNVIKGLSSFKRINIILRREYGKASSLLSLEDRGIWHDRFPPECLEFEQALTSGTTVYGGFDPTSDSLHIGNLLVLNALIYFQRHGHSVLALVGGATARVGDPSGKIKERPIMKEKIIEQNLLSIKTDIERIFKNHEHFIWNREDKPLKPVQILNNYDWYKELNLLDFFRNVGKAMRMGTLLTRSTIETRLSVNEPLSYTEFSYQILQAYDWLHLYKNYNCTVQVGGSDQMGNMHTGYDLINKTEKVQVTGLTVPLITSSTGDKMGKSSGSSGQIWLNPDKTHPFEFYQYFIRTKDADVEKLLKLLTFIPLPEIETVMKLHQEEPEKLRPQKKLAEHLTLLVHGDIGLTKAKRGTELLYGGNSTVLADMEAEHIVELFKGCNVKSLLLKPGTSVLDIAMAAQCFSDDRKAAEIIKAGGFYINQAKVTEPLLALIPGVHILPNGVSLLRVGKRNYYIVQWKS